MRRRWRKQPWKQGEIRICTHFEQRYTGKVQDPSVIFHVTFLVNIEPDEITVWLNDPDDVNCRGKAVVEGKKVFTKAPAVCLMEGKNKYVVIVKNGQSTDENIIYFDLEKDENYKVRNPICYEEQRIESSEVPCYGMSTQCLDGAFHDPDDCCAHDPVVEGIMCDDGDPDTATDRCIMGFCHGVGTEQDVDGDNVIDSEDRIIGDDQFVNTSMPLPGVQIRSLEQQLPPSDELVDDEVLGCGKPVSEVGTTSGLVEVTIYSGLNPRMRFNENLTNAILDLGKIYIDSSRFGRDSIGFLAVDFTDTSMQAATDMPGVTKQSSRPEVEVPMDVSLGRRVAIFVDKIADSREVCIKNVSPLTDPLLHSDCSAADEIRIVCHTSERGDTTETFNCDAYQNWLRVYMDAPGIVWQVPDSAPFLMRVHSQDVQQQPGNTWLPDRLRGILLCAGEGGPDCSDSYCSPGFDYRCVGERNLCRYGTGACSRMEWPEIPTGGIQIADEILSPGPLPMGGDGPPPPPPPWPGPSFCYPPCPVPGAVEACGFEIHCEGACDDPADGADVVCDGQRTCMSGSGCWTECRPNVLPGMEECNDVDDDCDGDVDEYNNRWPPVVGEPYHICEDRCFCSDEACQEWPFGDDGGKVCVSLGFSYRCNDYIECTEDICRPGLGWPGCEEGECCEHERDDVYCGGCGDCQCHGCWYCDPHYPHGLFEVVTGCREVDPCPDKSYCERGLACCDREEWCNGGVSYGFCQNVFRECDLRLAPPALSCDRARDASDCCRPGCDGGGSCGGSEREVHHPITGVLLGRVWCPEELWFMRDCGQYSGADNRCNQHVCQVSRGRCWIEPSTSCDDGLECTDYWTEDCISNRWGIDPSPYFDQYWYECRGTPSTCPDVDFCTESNNPSTLGMMGVGDVVCHYSFCNDRAGDGWTDRCDHYDEHPEESGCYYHFDPGCQAAYRSSNVCNEFICDEDVDACLNDPVEPHECADDWECTDDYCSVTMGGCYNERRDWWCEDRFGPDWDCRPDLAPGTWHGCYTFG